MLERNTFQPKSLYLKVKKGSSSLHVLGMVNALLMDSIITFRRSQMSLARDSVLTDRVRSWVVMRECWRRWTASVPRWSPASQAGDPSPPAPLMAATTRSSARLGSVTVLTGEETEERLIIVTR